jgi:murein DD-endopeptidase MepM/ murein hydrolase activator NlpD
MSKLRLEKSQKKSPLKGKGFYIALGVCLVAIGAAAWTTYDSVVKFQAPTAEESGISAGTPSSRTTQQAGTNVSGVKDDRNSSAASSKKEEVSSAPVSSAPEAASSQTSQPANTEPTLCIFPVGKTVTKEFSGTDPVYSLTFNDWRVHEGVDLSAAVGDVVRSITGGVVKEVYDDPILGKTIIIEHTPGFEAYYCGLGETTLVNKGDSVKMAQEIGSVKSVPGEIVEETHLHLGVKKDGKWINPLDVLEKTES